jgi:transposase
VAFHCCNSQETNMSVALDDTSSRVCDWARDDHAVCIVDVHGEVLDRRMVEHTAAGLKRLIRRLLSAAVRDVGIEHSGDPVIEALLVAELMVSVVPPNQVKDFWSRYGSAGNKDDRYDPYVLANVARTDRRRLTPLIKSIPVTIALRSTIRARRDPVEHRVATANHPLAHLQIAFPGRVGAEVLHQWMDGAPGGKTRHDADAHAHAAVTLAFVAVLRALNTQIENTPDSMAEQIADHPDAHIVASLPRAGTVRAAQVLAEIGDSSGRVPAAESLACLTGVRPSTWRSGKVKAATLRWSPGKELRDALCDFAGDCGRPNHWAEDFYQRARARGHDHVHAVRILGRPSANIIWRSWQDGVAYDPARPNAPQRVLNQRDPEPPRHRGHCHRPLGNEASAAAAIATVASSSVIICWIMPCTCGVADHDEDAPAGLRLVETDNSQRLGPHRRPQPHPSTPGSGPSAGGPTRPRR